MSLLRRQAVLLAAAVQFLTRLPTPLNLPFAPDTPVRATRWFPLVGALVGLICAAVWLAAGRLWPAPAAAVLAVAAGVLVTGGLHEDGLADTADGLGGGATPERRLEIMKDSRVGVFGVAAVALSLGLRAAALGACAPWTGACALVAAHGAARAAAVAAMAATPYAGRLDAAKGRPGGERPRAGEALLASTLGLLLLTLLPTRAVAAAVVLAGLGVAALLGLSRRLIGGHTGDVLGAVEQWVEACVLLGAAVRL